MVIDINGKELGKQKQVPLAITMEHLATILTALDHLINIIDDYKEMEGAPLDVMEDAKVVRQHIYKFLDQGEVKH